ncbi:hypothetical protein SAMN05216174_105320 [Actinokineospora iranica]|uniref:DUF3558 domain-containing protein n=1 Tax=Actinokineospora iranica TaxID=1271860 RepID=A0A1G6QJX5_9PSEU|nr:hypothetical protein SAMN05216174_105320 [Actinokineospora iranica]
MRERALILVASLLMAGCAAPVHGLAVTNDGQVASPWAEAEITESSDKNLRKVPRTSGEYFTYSSAETAAQTICHTMTPQRWSELLHGPVRREIYGSSTNLACLVTSNRMRIELATQDLDPSGWRSYIGTPSRDIQHAGRPGRVSTSMEAPFRADGYVTLVDDSSAANRNALTFRVTAGSLATMDRPSAFTDLVDDVLTGVIEPLAKPSSPMPAVTGELGLMGYVPTPPAPRGGVVDVPYPLSAQQLCTAAVAALGVDPATLTIAPHHDGQCRITNGADVAVSLWLRPNVNRAEFTETIAGRPVKPARDKLREVWLRDDVPASLWVNWFSGGDSTPFIEKLVPLLLAG